MPIIADRKTGEIISAPKLTQEQRQRAWEIIVRAYVEKHPELQQLGKEDGNERGPE